MSIGVVLAGAIVVVLRYRLVRCQLFQPHVVIVQQAVFGIIDEHRRRYMHGIHQTDSLLHAALSDQIRDGAGDVHKPATVWNLEP